jgi:hypothetical protein
MSNTTLRVVLIASLLLVLVACVAAVGNRSAPKQESASTADESGDYRIEVVPLGDGRPHMLKYRPDTGRAWYYSGEGAWVAIEDSEPVHRSHYVFEPSIDEQGWSVVRLDTRSGRTWITRDSIWVEVQDEPSSF